MINLFQDLRYAMRQSLKSPGFTAGAVVSLMLGIGATAAIFSVVYGILLDPYPYRDADRIVHVELHQKNGRFSQLMVDRTQFEAVRGGPPLEDVFFEDKQQKNLTGGNASAAVKVAFYSSNFFDFMGVPPLLGRVFTPADAAGGNSVPVAVLSYRFWREHYGESRDILGKAIELDHVAYIVIGVVPPRFTWGDSDVYALSTPSSSVVPYVLAYPRLKPGITFSAAETAFQPVVDGFAKEDPNYPQDVRVKVTSLNEELLGSFAGTIVFLFGAVVSLLVIACVNVSNLLLARGISRRHEFAVRASVGASRARLIRQLLTESLLLSMTGAALGVLASYWGVQVLSRMLPYDSIPHEAVIRLNAPVLIFSVVIAVMTGILFGMSPAFQLSRTRPGSLVQAISTRLADRTQVRRMHRLPIAGQVALTLLLLAGAGGALQGFLARIYTPLGFDPENVFQMFVELPRRAWRDPIDQRALVNELERVREAIAEAPGVDDAAASLTWRPLAREASYPVTIQNKRAFIDSRTVIMEISPQLFPVLRLPLLKGRVFDNAELRRRAPVAIVNQAFVRQYLSGLEPIGQVVRLTRTRFYSDAPLEVIGVAGDALNDEFDAVKPAVFIPYSLHNDLRPGELLFVRASSDAAAAMRSVRARLKELNPDLVVSEARTFRQSLETYGWGNQRLAATIFSIYAVIALALAATGIYGVVSFAVSQQKKALGIRLALGATPSAVMQLVVRSTGAMCAVGLTAGLIICAILSPIVSSWSGGRLSDPWTLLLSVSILVLVASIASILPARRAASIDPMQVLRSE